MLRIRGFMKIFTFDTFDFFTFDTFDFFTFDTFDISIFLWFWPVGIQREFYQKLQLTHELYYQGEEEKE